MNHLSANLKIKKNLSSSYSNAVENFIDYGNSIKCRQGLAYESVEPLILRIECVSGDFLKGLSRFIVPRTGKLESRIKFSVLYSLRRILGLPEECLVYRYPFLKHYLPKSSGNENVRSVEYSRNSIPDYIQEENWFRHCVTMKGDKWTINQFERVAFLLSDPKSRETKRAMVDFGEGFKSRCVLNWLFQVRGNSMASFQNMRTNDLGMGFPNNIIDAYLGNFIFSQIAGVDSAYVQHYANYFQVYERDISNKNALQIVKENISRYRGFDSDDYFKLISRSRFLNELSDLLTKNRCNRPPESGVEGVVRHRRLMCRLKEFFDAKIS